jgi:hypothetical protein
LCTGAGRVADRAGQGISSSPVFEHRLRAIGLDDLINFGLYFVADLQAVPVLSLPDYLSCHQRDNFVRMVQARITFFVPPAPQSRDPSLRFLLGL